MKKRTIFTRYKFNGKFITWCFNLNQGWIRIGNFQLRKMT